MRVSSIRAAVREALRRHRITFADVRLFLTSDAEMARLHRTHLQIGGPTDVLTFDLSDGVSADRRRKPRTIEGEIVISAEIAAREAGRRGHSLAAEVALYAVHGLLHLLGYDHRRPADALRMHRLEDRILVAVGLEPAFYGAANSERRQQPRRGERSPWTPMRPAELGGPRARSGLCQSGSGPTRRRRN